jgi:hypothetical protein
LEVENEGGKGAHGYETVEEHHDAGKDRVRGGAVV